MWVCFCLGLIFICEYWHYLKHGYSFIEQMIETMSLSYLGHNDDSIQMDKDGLGPKGLIFRILIWVISFKKLLFFFKKRPNLVVIRSYIRVLLISQGYLKMPFLKHKFQPFSKKTAIPAWQIIQWICFVAPSTNVIIQWRNEKHWPIMTCAARRTINRRGLFVIRILSCPKLGIDIFNIIYKFL